MTGWRIIRSIFSTAIACLMLIYLNIFLMMVSAFHAQISAVLHLTGFGEEAFIQFIITGYYALNAYIIWHWIYAQYTSWKSELDIIGSNLYKRLKSAVKAFIKPVREEWL